MNDVDLAAVREARAMDDKALVSRWLEKFERALQAGNEAAIVAMFDAESHWRDLVAFTWHITPFVGVDKIAPGLITAQPATQAYDFELDPDRTAPRRVTRLGFDVIEALFHFETALGRGNGVLRLYADNPSKCPSGDFMSRMNRLSGAPS